MTIAVDRAARDAAYARMREANALARSLRVQAGASARRQTLAGVVRRSLATLEAAHGVAGPSLIAHVRMQLAGALFDLAATERDQAQRARMVGAGIRAADLAVRTALASKAPFLAEKIVAWAGLALTAGLRSADRAQRARIQRLLVSCARALPRILAWRRREAREAAKTLFAARALTLAADRADAKDRSALLARAAAMAHQARRRALGAGDRRTAQQAQAAAPPTPRIPKFCPQCGTPTRGRGRFCGSCGTKLAK